MSSLARSLAASALAAAAVVVAQAPNQVTIQPCATGAPSPAQSFGVVKVGAAVRITTGVGGCLSGVASDLSPLLNVTCDASDPTQLFIQGATDGTVSAASNTNEVSFARAQRLNRHLRQSWRAGLLRLRASDFAIEQARCCAKGALLRLALERRVRGRQCVRRRRFASPHLALTHS